MTAVLTVALPVFAVIAAGFLAGRLRLAPADDVAALNRFVFRFAMPAALFGLTANAAPISAADGRLAAVYGVIALAMMAAGYGAARIGFGAAPEEAGAHALSGVFGNAVFLGLPIALSIPGWADAFVILMLVEGVGVIALGSALLAPRSTGGRGPFGALAGPARNPLVLAMIAGILVSSLARGLGVSLPAPALAFVAILGRAAGPTALFSLGLFLATGLKADMGAVGGRAAAIAAAKLLAMPGLMAAGLALAGIADPAVAGPAMLFAAVPSAVGSFVMASAAGVYVREAATAIALTTILSTATISLVLAVYA